MDSYIHCRTRPSSNLRMVERDLEVIADLKTTVVEGQPQGDARGAINARQSQDPVARVGAPRVLCVAPAWNEGERIARVVKAVPGDFVEATVVVDDGSTDGTADHAEGAGATVIRSGANRGVGAAIRSGIDHAIQHGYDIV